MSAYEFLVELECLPPRSSTVTTLRFATVGRVTGPADTPANTHYQERVTQAMDIAQSLFAEGTTYGRASVSVGGVELANQDGALDYLINYSFDHRAVRVYRLAAGAAFSSRTAIFTGTVLHPEFVGDTVQFTMRDRQTELDHPFQSVLFAGTGGVEGTGSDLKSTPKPILIGNGCTTLPVPIVDAALLIYQVSDRAGLVTRVSDSGIDLVAGATYASYADLLTVAPSAFTYRVYSGSQGCYVRLGSQPDGKITVDADEHADPADATAASLMVQMLLRLSLEKGDAGTYTVRAADVTAMDAANSAPLGRWVSDDVSATALLDELAKTVGASWLFDQTGEVRFQRLERPVTVGYTIPRVVEDSLERITPEDRDRGNPTWQQTIYWGRNYAPGQVLAAGVASDRRAVLEKEWRAATYENDAIVTRHKGAVVATEYTWFNTESDALAEATRRQLLRAERLHMFRWVTELTPAIDAREIGSVVGVKESRYQLRLRGDAVGTPLILTTKRPDTTTGLCEMIGWGATMRRANRVTSDGRYRGCGPSIYRVAA